jgi:hypothetical protein
MGHNTTVGLFRFKGEDGSLGYRKGRIYRLKITGWQIICIQLPYRCPYDSWELFFENWEKV